MDGVRDDKADEARAMLQAMFGPDDWIELLLLPSRARRWFRLGDEIDAADALEWAIEQSADSENPQHVYVAVGSRPRDAMPAGRIGTPDRPSSEGFYVCLFRAKHPVVAPPLPVGPRPGGRAALESIARQERLNIFAAIFQTKERERAKATLSRLLATAQGAINGLDEAAAMADEIAQLAGDLAKALRGLDRDGGPPPYAPSATGSESRRAR